MSFNQRQIIEQVYLFSIRKSLSKINKNIEEQGKKQIDAITNQNERLAALTNKDNHNDNYKKYLKN